MEHLPSGPEGGRCYGLCQGPGLPSPGPASRLGIDHPALFWGCQLMRRDRDEERGGTLFCRSELHPKASPWQNPSLQGLQMRNALALITAAALAATAVALPGPAQSPRPLARYSLRDGHGGA